MDSFQHLSAGVAMDYFNRIPMAADTTVRDNAMLYCQTFPDSNADLNAIFAEEPTYQSYINQQAVELAQPSWSDGLDLLEDSFDLRSSNQLVIDPSAIVPSESPPVSPTTTAATDEAPPPKRGRPRKTRAKKQLTDKEASLKRQKFLERNRLAASKCRDRRKIHTDQMQRRYADSQQTNDDLKIKIWQYRAEFQKLMGAIMEHKQEGCTNEYIEAMLSNPAILDILSSDIGKDLMEAESSPSRENSVVPSRQQSYSSNAIDSGFSSMGSIKTESPRNVDDEGYVSREHPKMTMSNPRLGTPSFSFESGPQSMFDQ